MFKKIIAMAIVVGGVCTMLALGNWQLDRLAWKTDILNKIEAQRAIDPMTTPLDFNGGDADWTRGFIRGRFIDKPSLRLVPRTFDGKVGAHILSPFKTVDNRVILVNRGWIMDGDTTVPSPPKGQIKIAGYYKRADAKGGFTPANNADQNLWYWVDHRAIAAFYDMDISDKILYLERPHSSRPMTFTDLPTPRNNHFQYAVFWFGMAGLLILLTLILYWKSRR